MTWRVELSEQASRQIKRLDKAQQGRIDRFPAERISTEEDPRRFGRPLQGKLAGLWRYRIGDYRLISRIEDERCVVLALAVGHRREVYRGE